MTFLIGGPIPVPHAGLGSTDWVVGILTIVGFAAVVLVAMILANRPVEVKPAQKESEESFRKAA